MTLRTNLITATTQEPPPKIVQTQTCSQNTSLLIAHVSIWTRGITTWWRHISITQFLGSTNFDFHTVSLHLNKLWNPKSRTNTNMWVGRDEQQSHIPCLTSMMQNKCFLSLQMLQTTKNKLIAPQVSPSKSVWVLGVLIRVISVFGLKGVFVTAETEVGCGEWRKHTSGRLSDTFQTTGRQSDFRPNHRWVCCNYPYIYIYIYIKNEVLISNSATVKVTCTILFRPSV